MSDRLRGIRSLEPPAVAAQQQWQSGGKSIPSVLAPRDRCIIVCPSGVCPNGGQMRPAMAAPRWRNAAPRHGIEVTAMPAPGRLKDKVAVVFGAGPNIGGTIAHFLARAGAQVAVSDIDADAAQATAQFLTTRGYAAAAFAGDAVEEAAVARVVAGAVERFGHVDVVVNMAGKVHWSSVLDMDLAQWREAVLSFPTAGMLTTKHGAKAMIAGGRRGSIIHLLSTAAHFGEADGAAYTAAKAALLNLARSAAMDLAHAGIRVNTITPCAMEHQLWTNMRAEIFDRDFKPPPRRGFYSRDDYLKMIPLGRFPRASDLAFAAVFLASDEASFITGADIPVDGGLRWKYPTWRPGDHTGANIADYARSISLTQYGEDKGKLIE
jgi:NAD(P)-dependent dehydrogenase (short-subunit alcohol dehydrogenase family)